MSWSCTKKFNKYPKCWDMIELVYFSVQEKMATDSLETMYNGYAMLKISISSPTGKLTHHILSIRIGSCRSSRNLAATATIS